MKMENGKFQNPFAVGKSGLNSDLWPQTIKCIGELANDRKTASGNLIKMRRKPPLNQKARGFLYMNFPF